MGDIASKATDEILFQEMPPDLKALQKQSRKELRERARLTYKQQHGLTKDTHPLRRNSR